MSAKKAVLRQAFAEYAERENLDWLNLDDIDAAVEMTTRDWNQRTVSEVKLYLEKWNRDYKYENHCASIQAHVNDHQR